MGGLEQPMPLAGHSSSAECSLQLPPWQALRQGKSAVGAPGAGGGDLVWEAVPGTCRCPAPTSRLGSRCAPPSSPALLPLPPPTPTAPSPEHKAASVQSIGVDNPGWGHIPGTSPDRPRGLALRTPTWALIAPAAPRPRSGLAHSTALLTRGWREWGTQGRGESEPWSAGQHRTPTASTELPTRASQPASPHPRQELGRTLPGSSFPSPPSCSLSGLTPCPDLTRHPHSWLRLPSPRLGGRG